MPRRRPRRVVAELGGEGCTLDHLDGVTIDHWDAQPRWWVNVRSSNTEPLLRLNVEAEDAALMESLRDRALEIIRERLSVDRGRDQGGGRGARRKPRHRGDQVWGVRADGGVVDARGGDPLGRRLRQPGAAARRRQAGAARGDRGAPVRLRAHALPLRVHGRDRAVHPRRAVRALRGVAQVPAPGADRVVEVGADRGAGRRARASRASPSAPRSWRRTRCAAG